MSGLFAPARSAASSSIAAGSATGAGIGTFSAAAFLVILSKRYSIGSETKTVGYDVSYRYDGAEHTIRMDDKPGERLPVFDGQVVTQVAAAAGSNDNG